MCAERMVLISALSFFLGMGICSIRAVQIRASIPAPIQVEIVRLIDELRAAEGDHVTILCDNPDFNGQPDRVITVCGDWTGWRELRFGGETLVDALREAAAIRRGLPPSRAAD